MFWFLLRCNLCLCISSRILVCHQQFPNVNSNHISALVVGLSYHLRVSLLFGFHLFMVFEKMMGACNHLTAWKINQNSLHGLLKAPRYRFSQWEMNLKCSDNLMASKFYHFLNYYQVQFQAWGKTSIMQVRQ